MIDQVEYWSGPPGERWAREQPILDAKLAPFGAAAVDAARVVAGESVLDVGCGCGDTSLALAVRVGATGRVVGLDLSPPMLARARERGRSAPNLTFVEGDASRAELDIRFDVVFSRFGVMFFVDPLLAFRHLGAALRPGGRVSFACWRSLADNPWARVPFEAAVKVAGAPEPAPPDAPGPFSFADRARVQKILDGAGFVDVAVEAIDRTMEFGAGGAVRDAASEIVRLGPVARLLGDRSEDVVKATLAAVEDALVPYIVASGGVSLPAAAWVATARAPGAKA